MYPFYIQQLIANKSRSWHKRFIEGGHNRYKQCVTQFTEALAKYHKNIENKILRSGYMSEFYRYDSMHKKVSSGIGSLCNCTDEFWTVTEHLCLMVTSHQCL